MPNDISVASCNLPAALAAAVAAQLHANDASTGHTSIMSRQHSALLLAPSHARPSALCTCVHKQVSMPEPLLTPALHDKHYKLGKTNCPAECHQPRTQRSRQQGSTAAAVAILTFTALPPEPQQLVVAQEVAVAHGGRVVRVVARVTAGARAVPPAASRPRCGNRSSDELINVQLHTLKEAHWEFGSKACSQQPMLKP